MKRLTLALVMSLIAAFIVTSTLHAQQPTPANGRDPVVEQEILKRLGALSADAVPIFENATNMLDTGEPAQAKQLFEFVLQLAPRFPEALRRLSYAELSLGNVDAAIAHAREAVQADNSPYNRVTLARALLSANDPALNVEALTIAKSAVKDAPDDLATNESLMWAGAANQDKDSIRQGSNALVRLAPDYAWGHYYLGMLALEEGQRQKGQQELQVAKNLGVPEEMVSDALNSTKPAAATPAPVQAPAQTGTQSPGSPLNADRGMTPLFLGAIAIAGILLAIVGVRYLQRRAR